MALEIVGRLLDQKLSILVEGGGTLLFASDRRGLISLRDASFNNPELLDGSDVALPAVGLAAAYLLIHAKAGRVFSKIMSQEARAALKEEGIEHASLKFTRKFPVLYRSYSEPLDAYARSVVTPQAFVEEIKRQLA